MANIIYDSLKEGLLDGSIDLLTDTIKTLFVIEYNASDDIVTSASELSATVSFGGVSSSATPLTEIATSGNYTSYGYELSGTVVSGGSTSYWSASDIVVSASSLTVGGMLLYKYTGVMDTSIPLGYIDFGVYRVTDNGNFTVQWNSDGIISMETKT